MRVSCSCVLCSLHSEKGNAGAWIADESFVSRSSRQDLRVRVMMTGKKERGMMCCSITYGCMCFVQSDSLAERCSVQSRDVAQQKLPKAVLSIPIGQKAEYRIGELVRR